MALFSKIDGYVKQAALYLKNGDYEKAYSLSTEMLSAYPNEMISRYMLAKSALMLGRYDEAVLEGSKALNASSAKADMSACALLVATARYMLGKYGEGYELLKSFGSEDDENVEKMMLIFSAVLGDEAEAERHARRLLKLNRQAAEELIERFLEGSEKA